MRHTTDFGYGANRRVDDLSLVIIWGAATGGNPDFRSQEKG